VKYEDLFGNDPGCYAHMCCTCDPNPSATCDQFRIMTREEAERETDAWEKKMNQFTRALHAAHADARQKGLKRGNGGMSEVKCPNCEGTIRYSVASINGHMHAACTTKGCASWME
jgi:hypothetical protein